MGEKKGGMGACAGGAALFQLKNVRSHKAKIELLEGLMNDCAKSRMKKIKSTGSGKGTKRKMSGYNCFMKKCAKDTGDFQKCLTDKGWAKLSNEQKNKYNNMAMEGCNID